MVYSALFEASSEALRLLAADPKFVGTDRIGFFGVLHTWGRTLEYHPHVHYVVPGGGLSADGSSWLPSRADFFVPVEALSIIFRAKFRDTLKREGLAEPGRPRGVASGLGGELAGRGRRPSRRFAISPRTSSAWRSATIASSRATTARSPSPIAASARTGRGR